MFLNLESRMRGLAITSVERWFRLAALSAFAIVAAKVGGEKPDRSGGAGAGERRAGGVEQSAMPRSQPGETNHVWFTAVEPCARLIISEAGTIST